MTNKSIPCKVDALSMTWSPQELLHIKQLAKIGACVKQSTLIEVKNSAVQRKLNNLEIKRNADLKNAKPFDVQDYSNVLSEYKESCLGITREYNERKFKSLNSNSFRLAENEVSARYELREMLKSELEVDTSKNMATD